MRAVRPALLVAACLFACTQAPIAAAEEAPAAPADLAEPPLWPIGLPWAAEKPPKPGTPEKAGLLVWVPPDAKRIRALFVVPNNTDSKGVAEHAAVREVAAKRGMAIVYLREGDYPAIQPILDAVAAKTGIVEFRHAPWIAFGKSSRGGFAHNMVWAHPERTIATINYHGAVPTWPPPEGSKLAGQTILHVNANGETEWGGTWYNHVRPSLLNYRAKQGWLPHQVVVKDVGHGDYIDSHGSPGWGKPHPGKVSCLEVWSYLALFMDKALALRLPAEGYPTDGPLTLRQVDESQGLLIDPFAVEAMFGVPRLPLSEKDGTFLPGGVEEPPISGYATIAPPAGFSVPEGVPVVPYASGQSPRAWILTDSLKFAMEADPMLDLGPLRTLQPKPGDQVTIDGSTLTFQPIIPKYVGPNGGLAMNTGLRPPKFDAKITLLAYTVLDFPERRNVKVNAGFSAATRVQLVLSGVPLRHKQILTVEPGKHPLLFVLRMAAKWDRVEPSLQDATEEEMGLAKGMQAEVERATAEYEKMKADGKLAPALLIRPVAEVPEADRRRMLWLADRELADAWLKLHQQPHP